MPNLNLRSVRGFSLFEVIIVAGILAVVTAFSGGLVTNLIATQRRNQLASELDGFRELIRSNLKSRVAWNNTLATVGSANNVPTANFATVALRDGQNQILLGYNPNNLAQGLDANGRPCTTYPSAQCPVRFNIQWKGDASSCNGAIAGCQREVEVQVTVLLAANTMYSGLNTDKLALRVKKAGESYSEVTTTCPTPGDVVIGFDAIGNPTCSPHMAVLAAGSGGPSTGAPSTGAPSTGAPSKGAPSTGSPAPKSPSPKGK